MLYWFENYKFDQHVVNIICIKKYALILIKNIIIYI
jgi:hypothetical protein